MIYLEIITPNGPAVIDVEQIGVIQSLTGIILPSNHTGFVPQAAIWMKHHDTAFYTELSPDTIFAQFVLALHQKEEGGIVLSDGQIIPLSEYSFKPSMN